MPFDPDYSDDKTLMSVWSLINSNCTDRQRDKFNEFRDHMHNKANSLRDWVQRQKTERDVEVPHEMNKLIDAILAMVLEGKTATNKLTIKKLPWLCGECGKHEVQNLRVYKGGPSLIATCDHCGSEWVS